MKLIDMTDFVLEQSEKIAIDITFMVYSEIIIKYANLLKQPLEIWMFVPCDEYGNILEKPKSIKDSFNIKSGHGGFFDQKSFLNYMLKYQQAKERCLFEGFEIKKDSHKSVTNGVISFYFGEPRKDTVENLCKQNLQLTQTAIKQLGL